MFLFPLIEVFFPPREMFTRVGPRVYFFFRSLKSFFPKRNFPQSRAKGTFPFPLIEVFFSQEKCFPE